MPEDSEAVDRNSDTIAYYKLCDKLWTAYQDRKKMAQSAGLPDPPPPMKPNANSDDDVMRRALSKPPGKIFFISFSLFFISFLLFFNLIS